MRHRSAPRPDLLVVMGGDNGFLRLVTLPEVTSYAALKGKALTVDARTTGYAFVLEKMLQLGGLREGEYQLVKWAVYLRVSMTSCSTIMPARYCYRLSKCRPRPRAFM